MLVSHGVWKLEMVVETNVGPKLTDELRGSIPLQATKEECNTEAVLEDNRVETIYSGQLTSSIWSGSSIG